MKKLAIHSAVLSIFLCSALAQAALPPAAESMRRIGAIAKSREVFNALGSASWVKSISDNNNGTYTVMAGDCALLVRVEAVQTNPPQMVPALNVVVEQVNCLP